jgi:predicted Fe-S protein YdhL (DUF1289 family)
MKKSLEPIAENKESRRLPATSCVKGCKLDGDNYCLGCGRHISEITNAGLTKKETKYGIN